MKYRVKTVVLHIALYAIKAWAFTLRKNNTQYGWLGTKYWGRCFDQERWSNKGM